MAAGKPLSIAYTPDSDDAFYYDALERGRVSLPGYRPAFSRAPMSVLNRGALSGVHDVTAISSVIYPQIARRYAILSVGTSVGRGYGPVLVSKDERTLEELRGRRVGVPGIPNTGWFLLRCLCPEAVPIEMPFDQIAEAVASGRLEAGVMIHEELLYYPRLGLRCVVDLGTVVPATRITAPGWTERNPPRPRASGDAEDLHAIRHSLQYALDHSEEVLARVSRFGRGSEGQCTERFVAMFANADSVRMPADVRLALRVLFSQTADLGISPVVPPIDIVEGSASDSRARPSSVA